LTPQTSRYLTITMVKAGSKPTCFTRCILPNPLFYVCRRCGNSVRFYSGARARSDMNHLFGKHPRTQRRLFQKQRANLARKLENPSARIYRSISPHISPLESHNGIPQNQRHPPRKGNPWPQINQQYPAIHAARHLQGRRVHRQSRALRKKKLLN
jgi:hypothetical protein